ncbi:uncharacterized protein LOC126679421 [Mercurialis annua]|uniref:uncharacterized protein LOC126679421 n=1 Tax=Mercurialis annua TaxID=3986 RepID=UPI00215F313C|nr:uncharacterized protein LOC126679421 [Mercurialis annua]
MAEKTNSVIISDTPSNSSLLNPQCRIVCHVCHKQFSQYTCPRCNSRYCSLHCYKSHSTRCTESFMRENVVEELRQTKPDDESKRKMMDILKRYHSEEEMDSMEEDDCLLSEETIQKILSGDSICYEDLSAEEQKQFQRTVASGELSKLIQPWDPWWLKPSARTISLSKEGTQLIQPLSKQEVPLLHEDRAAEGQSSEIPPGPEAPLVPVAKLISAEPSPLLAVHLVDIIYSYCFTLRLYNGDWPSDAIGSAMVVLSISSVLGQGRQPETVTEVVSYCLEQTCSPEYRRMGGLQFGLGIISDVIQIISLGGPALICALCDLQRLFQAGERELKAERLKKSTKSETRSKLKLGERKVYFMMCWVHEQPMEAWHSLSAILETEKSKVMDYYSSSNTINSAGKKNNPESRGKLFIEEIK